MAFTRNFLKSTGLTDDQITAVIEEHTAVTDALKKERDGYKEQADKAADLQKQLDDLASEDYKTKFEEEHKAFEDFKKQTASEAEAAKVRSAYRKLLAGEGISEKRLDAIINSVADGIIVMNISHKIIRVNPAFKKMIGLKDEIVSKFYQDDLLKFKTIEDGLLLEEAEAGGWPLNPESKHTIAGDIFKYK